MHGGAVTLARKFSALDFKPDLILATDMLDLSTFLSLSRRKTAHIPVVLYMHENQLTYPLPEDPSTGPMRRQGGERDLHYAFINYTSMLSATRVVFNSEYHRRSFIEALPGFLNHFPEFRETRNIQRLETNSSVLPVGLDVTELESDHTWQKREKPLILWNQRWEYDKNPEEFFQAILALSEENITFDVALCGESFQKQPKVFESATSALAERLIHCGYAERHLYRRLLWEATVTVSTALHEFFGISILEAALCETLTLVPNRLSYPEILPSEFHEHCLYNSYEELLQLLRRALTYPQSNLETASALATHIRSYDWKIVAPKYDHFLKETSQCFQ